MPDWCDEPHEMEEFLDTLLGRCSGGAPRIWLSDIEISYGGYSSRDDDAGGEDGADGATGDGQGGGAGADADRYASTSKDRGSPRSGSDGERKGGRGDDGDEDQEGGRRFVTRMVERVIDPADKESGIDALSW